MWRQTVFLNILKILFTLILFLFSIELLKEAFQNLGIQAAETLILATSNPFIALFIGLLITAIIQSSSTTSSLIVALVASGNISIPDAVPMLLGANIGTTLTSSIVALAFITKPREFERAISAGVVHDFFNILTALIVFPLEINYGLLSSAAIGITEVFMEDSSFQNGNIYLFGEFSPASWLVNLINNHILIILLAFLLLFGSIKLLVDILSRTVIGKSKDRLKHYVFHNPLKSFGWGTLVTASVQSSSITTSLVVPLVATGKVTLQNVAPFIMGANIGTTITAFIAALYKSNAALSIAVAHLLFNLFAVLLFLPLPWIRNKLVQLSAAFGSSVIRYRSIGLLYILLTFFIIPFALIYFNRENNSTTDTVSDEKVIHHLHSLDDSNVYLPGVMGQNYMHNKTAADPLYINEPGDPVKRFFLSR